MILFFFFNDTATTEIYTLSLHDALPISGAVRGAAGRPALQEGRRHGLLPDHHEAGEGPDPARLRPDHRLRLQDRKSTRLNSSHANISYAVFCLKKKKKLNTIRPSTQHSY